ERTAVEHRHRRAPIPAQVERATESRGGGDGVALHIEDRSAVLQIDRAIGTGQVEVGAQGELAAGVDLDVAGDVRGCGGRTNRAVAEIERGPAIGAAYRGGGVVREGEIADLVARDEVEGLGVADIARVQVERTAVEHRHRRATPPTNVERAAEA